MKKNLKEALGVPENLYETSIQIYNRLVNALKRVSKDDFVPGVGKQLKFRGQFRISDFPFSTVKFQVGVEPNKKVEFPELISMVIRSESLKTDDFRLKTVKSKTIDLLAIIVVPEDYDYTKLSEFITTQRDEIIQNLSHELKHGYDHEKKPYDNPHQRAEYMASINKSFNIPSVDRFLHDIYFISVNENLVRPSEVMAAIKNNQISQKDFLAFLRSHETYLNLKRISQFTTTQLKSDLSKDMKYVNRFLKKLDFDVDTMTDRKKINEILRLVWVNLTNWKIQEFQKILTSSFIEELLGFEGEKQKVFERFVKRNQRFKNYREFFNFYENHFQNVANLMIKKIAKLYAITQ